MFRVTSSLILSLLLLSSFSVQAQEDDRPASTNNVISVEVLIFEVAGQMVLENPDDIDLDELMRSLKDLQAPNKLQYLKLVRLSTLDGHEAMLQTGDTTSVPVNRVSVPSRGGEQPRFATNYEMMETGTIIKASPVINSQGMVMLELDLNQSLLEAAPPTDDQALSIPRTTTLTVQTTVKTVSGRGILISGDEQLGKEADSQQTYVVVRATILE